MGSDEKKKERKESKRDVKKSDRKKERRASKQDLGSSSSSSKKDKKDKKSKRRSSKALIGVNEARDIGGRSVSIDEDEYGDQWMEQQVHAFSGFVNFHLSKKGLRVIDLVDDLADGGKLCVLLEVLSGKTIKDYDLEASTEIQKIQNCNIALDFLKREGLHLVNISGKDLVDKNAKLVLGMLWAVIREYHINLRGEAAEVEVAAGLKMSEKGKLLYWCNTLLEQYNIKVKDFGTSFKSGVAFANLVYAVRPDLIVMSDIKQKVAAYKSNLQVAFDAAEKLGAPPLLKSDYFLGKVSVDAMAVMTYLAFIRQVHAQIEAEKAAATKKLESEVSTLVSDLGAKDAEHQAEFDKMTKILERYRARIRTLEERAKEAQGKASDAQVEEVGALQERLRVLEEENRESKERASALELQVEKLKTKLAASDELVREGEVRLAKQAKEETRRRAEEEASSKREAERAAKKHERALARAKEAEERALARAREAEEKAKRRDEKRKAEALSKDNLNAKLQELEDEFEEERDELYAAQDKLREELAKQEEELNAQVTELQAREQSLLAQLHEEKESNEKRVSDLEDLLHKAQAKFEGLYNKIAIATYKREVADRNAVRYAKLVKGLDEEVENKAKTIDLLEDVVGAVEQVLHLKEEDSAKLWSILMRNGLLPEDPARQAMLDKCTDLKASRLSTQYDIDELKDRVGELTDKREALTAAIEEAKVEPDADAAKKMLEETKKQKVSRDELEKHLAQVIADVQAREVALHKASDELEIARHASKVNAFRHDRESKRVVALKALRDNAADVLRALGEAAGGAALLDGAAVAKLLATRKEMVADYEGAFGGEDDAPEGLIDASATPSHAQLQRMVSGMVDRIKWLEREQKRLRGDGVSLQQAIIDLKAEKAETEDVLTLFEEMLASAEEEIAVGEEELTFWRELENKRMSEAKKSGKKTVRVEFKSTIRGMGTLNVRPSVDRNMLRATVRGRATMMGMPGGGAAASKRGGLTGLFGEGQNHHQRTKSILSGGPLPTIVG